MSVYSILIVLRCSSRGRNISHDEFVGPLSLVPEDGTDGVISDRGPGATSSVRFVPIRLREYAPTEEPAEAFAAGVQERLLQVAAFLGRRAGFIFELFRREGLAVCLFIDVWMDVD